MAKVIALNQNSEQAIPTNYPHRIIAVGIFISAEERKVLLLKKFNFSMLLLPGGTIEGENEAQEQVREEANQLSAFVYEKSGFILKPVKPLFILDKTAKGFPIKVYLLDITQTEPKPEWVRNDMFNDVWLSLNKINDHPQVSNNVKGILRYYLEHERAFCSKPKRLEQPVPIITLA